MRRRVPKVVQIAGWLAEHDVPAVRLLSDVPHPLQVHGHLATLWHAVPVVGPKPTGNDLAAILQRLHHITPLGASLPCIGPREWELTPVAVGALRFRYPGHAQAELAERYGFDVTTWPGFPTLRRGDTGARWTTHG